MYIYLDVVKQFSCAMCGACCRRDWLVTVDEASYRRNAEWFSERERYDEFQKAFVRIEDRRGPGEYAYIAKGRDGGCWFLEKTNICRLHREAGHAQLDGVCQTFPRYPMDTARGLELTLSFSCPAVLALVSRTSPLAVLRSAEPPLSLGPGNAVAAVFPGQQQAGSPLRYYFELEHHFIDLVQHRGLPLGDRLGLLRETVRAIASLTGPAEPGQGLNTIIRTNYERLDAFAVPQQEAHVTAEILAEHFMVNLIFKKLFYLYGLQRTADFLEEIWRKLRTAATKPGGLEQVKALIMEMELCYNHDRKALLAKPAKPWTARPPRSAQGQGNQPGQHGGGSRQPGSGVFLGQ
ncbi:MAG TPA: flagellin lysine-N-methylase [Selenomonadales bacterium]|nr:flagellin lysine-N-methylase [Selenomonadales bacterium]